MAHNGEPPPVLRERTGGDGGNQDRLNDARGFIADAGSRVS